MGASSERVSCASIHINLGAVTHHTANTIMLATMRTTFGDIASQEPIWSVSTRGDPKPLAKVGACVQIAAPVQVGERAQRHQPDQYEREPDHADHSHGGQAEGGEQQRTRGLPAPPSTRTAETARPLPPSVFLPHEPVQHP